MAIGPARLGTARAHARHGPEDVGPAQHAGLPGRAQPGVVLDQGPRHGLLGRFSGQAGTRRHGLPSVPGWPEAHREGKGRAGLQEAGRRGRRPPPPARSP